MADLLVREVAVLILAGGIFDRRGHLEVVVVRGLLVIDRFLDDLEGSRGHGDHGGGEPITLRAMIPSVSHPLYLGLERA